MNKGFFDSVYNVVKQIPKGKVATYGQIALIIGRPRSSRYVGYALHSNPQPKIVPCHRIVNREGCLSSAFAFGGIDEQKRLLLEEGVDVDAENKVDLEKYQWVF